MLRSSAFRGGVGLQRRAATTFLVGALACTQRTIFIREYRIPITIYDDDGTRPGAKAVPASGYPASLKWEYRSSRPRHLVVSVEPPETPLIGGEVGLGDGAVSTNFDALEAGGSSLGDYTDEDYMFGRLFLRPYNVAQLLSVFHGWAPKGISIDREYANLSLAPAVPKKRSAPSKHASPSTGAATPLSDFVLTGSFTTKSIPALDEEEESRAGVTGHDAEAESDPMLGSVYSPDDRRRIRVELKDAELVLLINHLESSLRDLFTMEHRFHEAEKRESLQRQREWLDRRASHPPRAAAVADAGVSSPRDTPAPRTQYRSQMARASPASPPSQPAAAATTGESSRYEDLVAAASAAIGAQAGLAAAAAAAAAAVVTEVEVADVPLEEFEEFEEEEDVAELEDEQDFALSHDADVGTSALDGAPQGVLEEINLDALVGDEEAELAADDGDVEETILSGAVPLAKSPAQLANQQTALREEEEAAVEEEEVEEFEELEELEEVEEVPEAATQPASSSAEKPITRPAPTASAVAVEDEDDDLPEVVVDHWDKAVETTKAEEVGEDGAEEAEELEELEEIEEVEEAEAPSEQRVSASEIFGRIPSAAATTVAAAAVGAAGAAASRLQGTATSRTFGDESGTYKVGQVNVRDPVTGAHTEGRYGVGDRSSKIGDLNVDERVRVSTHTTTSADRSFQSQVTSGTRSGTFQSETGNVTGSFFVAKSTSHVHQSSTAPLPVTAAPPKETAKADAEEVEEVEEVEEEEQEEGTTVQAVATPASSSAQAKRKPAAPRKKKSKSKSRRKKSKKTRKSK